MSDRGKPGVPQDGGVEMPSSATPDATESYSPKILLRSKPADDRRDCARRSYYVGVHIAGDAEVSFGLSGNISEGGIFVVTRDPPPLSARVELEFLLKDTSASLIVEGEVRWVRRQWTEEEALPPGFGVEFDELKSTQRDVLAKLLAELDG